MGKIFFQRKSSAGEKGIGLSTEKNEDPVVIRPPGPIDRLLITASALSATIGGLALGRDREMLCYWVGTAIPADSFGTTRALVTTVAFPQIESRYDYFRIVDGQIGLVTNWCAARGMWILAQAHTHPTDEPHSEADECWPVSHREGFISVVFPYFAQMSTVREPHWRAHELMDGRNWREIDPAKRFGIVNDVWLPGMR